uniref:Pleckstrin y domain-containing A member 3 n=1 Tax=Sphaerodactylus townsendi TaxID=933632 RepID=A0ACB8G1D8_9SAUR
MNSCGWWKRTPFLPSLTELGCSLGHLLRTRLNSFLAGASLQDPPTVGAAIGGMLLASAGDVIGPVASCADVINVGWQPRWFVLDNGILSYYDSQDDVCKGSKGSIKMAVCEIKVHPTDSTRMELIIPGEQHFYMKAVNAAERQRWLVALGSSKACLADSRSKKEKEMNETNDSLKTKMSELRLYCDLLMQQVHTIQEYVHHDESHSSPSMEG